jgi:hypothetical protein
MQTDADIKRISRMLLVTGERPEQVKFRGGLQEKAFGLNRVMPRHIKPLVETPNQEVRNLRLVFWNG